ncbi:MAG: gamma-glutamyltransferase, partial [Deltaproteobacteria bacterium]|nr:gamma-glutamyltransferase [Deltaproteobacteria bacterium]
MAKKIQGLLLVCFLILAALPPADAVIVGPSLKSKHGMVVAANPLAAKVGAEILEKGGNAVDAAIAVSFALGVVEPYASSIGGEGYAILSLADGRKFAIDFRSTAPARATYENLAATGMKLNELKETPKGYCVPGVVAGAAKAHEIGATLPLKDLIAPAAGLAEEGFEVNETFAKVVKDSFEKLSRNAPMFLNGGLPWEKGDKFRNPALAKTLQIIAEKGADAFYRGELADSLEAFMKKNDGWVSKSDLETYRAEVKKPIHGTYRGYDLYVAGNPVGGPRLLASLNILENFNLAALGWNDPLAVHIMQEAFILTALDQGRYVGDPAFDELPEKGYISKEYA